MNNCDERRVLLSDDMKLTVQRLPNLDDIFNKLALPAISARARQHADGVKTVDIDGWRVAFTEDKSHLTVLQITTTRELRFLVNDE
jgi:hypothetical protein